MQQQTVDVEHLEKVLAERELRGDAAGSYRSRAVGEGIEVEHFEEVLIEIKLRGDAAASYSSRALGEGSGRKRAAGGCSSKL